MLHILSEVVPLLTDTLQSQAIKTSNQVYLSGQIPANVKKNLIKESTMEKTETIIKNTKTILKKARSGLDKIIKIIVRIKYYKYSPRYSLN